MVMEGTGRPLAWRDMPVPMSEPGEVRVTMSTCGVYRTGLHVVDNELTISKPPLTPGHRIVNIIESCGKGVTTPTPGEYVGVSRLGWTCSVCPYCLHECEGLCDHPAFTGYTRDDGYAQYAVCDTRYCLPTPTRCDDACITPLLCTGLIGYHTLRVAGDARKIGIYSFDAAAHLITQVAATGQHEVFTPTRTGDTAAQ